MALTDKNKNYEKLEELNPGYNIFTEIEGKHSDMLMDIGVYLLGESGIVQFFDADKETAFMILDGEVRISYNGLEQRMERRSLFDQRPMCLHVPKETQVKIYAISKSEILIQKTKNTKSFAPVFYGMEDIDESILGDNVWQNTARRVIRTVFDYNNAPYSNMVLGEVITLPGRWSSYPPHSHPQPEVYYYRFDKNNGFGISIIGDSSYIVKDNSIAAIPGGLSHPQASAPGYAMYYCWMIRHLDNDPWTYRTFDEDHTWLNENPHQIWQPKE